MLEKRFLNIREAASYVGFAVPTLYQYACQKKIPFIRKNKRLRFDVEQLDRWMEQDAQAEVQVAEA